MEKQQRQDLWLKRTLGINKNSGKESGSKQKAYIHYINEWTKMKVKTVNDFSIGFIPTRQQEVRNQ